MVEEVTRRPGIHARELARSCDVPLSTAGYHLGVLARAGRVAIWHDGRYKRIFPADFPADAAAIHGALRRRAPAAVLRFLADGRDASRRDIALGTRLAVSTVGGALALLHRKGVLAREFRGGRFIYRAREPGRIREIGRSASEHEWEKESPEGRPEA